MMRIFLNKKELQTTINIWFHQVNAHLVKKRKKEKNNLT